MQRAVATSAVSKISHRKYICNSIYIIYVLEKRLSPQMKKLTRVRFYEKLHISDCIHLVSVLKREERDYKSFSFNYIF